MPRKTKTAAPPVPPPGSINRCKPLDEWLERHGAVMLWETSLHGEAPRIQGWSLNPGMIIVLRYGYQGRDGWDIYTANGISDVATALADAEQRLGLAPDPPHGWKETHVYGANEPPIWKAPGGDATAWTEDVDGEPNLVAGDEDGVATAYLPFGFVRQIVATYKPTED